MSIPGCTSHPGSTQERWINGQHARWRPSRKNPWKSVSPVHRPLPYTAKYQTSKRRVTVAAGVRTEDNGNKSVSKGTDSRKIVEDLKDRLQGAVIAERDADIAALTLLYSESTTQRLAKNGNVLLNLTATIDGKLFRSTKVKLQPLGTDLPRHRFDRGDPIYLSSMKTASKTVDPDNVQNELMSCTVLEVNHIYLIVVLDAESPSQIEALSLKASRWRIDKGSSDATSKRQLQAINALGEKPTTMQEAAIQAFIIGLNYPPALVQNNVPQWVKQERWRQESGRRLKSIKGLNESQRLAIAYSQKQLLTLWQGPPGSGKTWSLLTLIDVVCTANRAVPEQSSGTLLACSDTNTAVDNLVEGLMKKSINVVRIGPPGKVREGLRSVTLDGRAQETEWGLIAMQMQDQADHLHKLATKEEDYEEKNALYQRARGLSWESGQLLDQAAQKVLDEAEVIACTCSGAGSSSMEGRHFRMVILDEATQCTEPSTVVPLVKGAECLVCAGDPQQLPPTVLSAQGVEAGLTITLFDRLVERGLVPQLLDTQYRMHDEISSFASEWFYKGMLKTGVDVRERPMPRGIKWANPKCPVLLAVCPGKDEVVKTGQSRRSYRNRTEAKMVMRVLSHVLAPGDVRDVGILTPYSGQVLELEHLLAKVKKSLSGARVCVSSVDGYQGQEADVIIFSTVRSNDDKKLGFVRDARRLNVAITRARRGLVVIGDPDTLASSPDWRAWLQWVKGRKCYISASNIPSSPWEVST